jgi:hypothetical protein
MYMNTNVDSALSWPVVSQDCLEALENGAWPIQPQRRWKLIISQEKKSKNEDSAIAKVQLFVHPVKPRGLILYSKYKRVTGKEWQDRVAGTGVGQRLSPTSPGLAVSVLVQHESHPLLLRSLVEEEDTQFAQAFMPLGGLNLTCHISGGLQRGSRPSLSLCGFHNLSAADLLKVALLCLWHCSFIEDSAMVSVSSESWT